MFRTCRAGHMLYLCDTYQLMKPQKQQIDEDCVGDVCRFPHATSRHGVEKHELAPKRMSDISWRIFKIMAEFVSGFEFLSTSSKEVTVFGSARTPEDNHWYQETVRLTKMLGDDGFTIITGGGPGIMEAANRGAYEAGVPSLGINIELPFEQRTNPYVTRSHGFHYFFSRKVVMTASGQAYIYCPGGFGTLDEFFEIITLIQTQKMSAVPIVLLGKEYWEGLMDWVTEVVLNKFENISKEDMDLFHIVDTAEEAFEIVKNSEERTIF